MVDVLVTNGGPHPADKWASLVADRIVGMIQIADNSDSPEAVAARKAKPRFAIALSDALEPVFDAVSSAEEARVESGEVMFRHAPFDISPFVDPGLAALASAASGTPFSAHFSDPDVVAAVRPILEQNFIDAANIQRSWALDKKGL